MSLKSGQFPVAWKEALFLPLLKKPGHIFFKNFRPVSNLPFVSSQPVYNQISNLKSQIFILTR